MDDKKSIQRVRKIGLIVTVVAVVWFISPLRLADPELNQALSIALFWAVFVGIGVTAVCLPLRPWIQLVIAVPMGLVMLAYPFMIFFSMIAGGPFAKYETVDTVNLEHSRVVAYRSRAGATDHYRLSIFHEMRIFPGVVLAKNLHYGNKEQDATLEFLTPDSVVAVIYGEREPYQVKPFVYF